MNPDLDARFGNEDSAGDTPALHLHVIAVPAASEIQLAAEFIGNQFDPSPGLFDTKCVLALYPHRVLFRGLGNGAKGTKRRAQPQLQPEQKMKCARHRLGCRARAAGHCSAFRVLNAASGCRC